jgi:hypothetical protein
MPHYWSELFLLAFQLFEPDSPEYTVLQDQIVAVENIIFNEKELRAGLSLYDIEMAIESNPDYYAYFERHDGHQVTKFDVERELNKIKQWIYSEVRVRAVTRKFRRFR